MTMNSDHAARAPSQPNPSARFFTRNTPDASARVGAGTSTRINLTYEDLSVTNVSRATSLSLYRERARDIRAVFERMWRCYADNRVTEFIYDSHEGDGDDASRVRHLRAYVDRHVTAIERLRMDIMRCSEAKQRWKRANRSGGVLVKKMRERSQAVLNEIIQRESNGTWLDSYAEATTSNPNNSAEANIGGVGTVVRAEALVVTREQEKLDRIAEDDRRHHARLDMEEAGIKKPSVGDRLIAQRTRAYERGDALAVSSVDSHIAKRQATRRFARHRAKARKAAIKRCRRDYAMKNRSPDPPSDHENTNGV